MPSPAPALADLFAALRACRLCRDAPQGKPLPHEPRPVLRLDPASPILICSQAPGLRVHEAGLPFADRSGDRLRQWLGVSSAAFYDPRLFSFAPMGFCFPGYSPKGADLPPRPECRTAWHDRIFALLPPPRLLVLVGHYATAYHLRRLGLERFLAPSFNEILSRSSEIRAQSPVPLVILPHPSWRNTGWLKRNPWFEQDRVPHLRNEVASLAHAALPGQPFQHEALHHIPEPKPPLP